MTEHATASILLVDDGELDALASALDAEGREYTRLRGGQIPAEIPPPRDLLVVTPRRVERVRRGSPPDAAPGYPLRIIAVEEDSPAMRRRLRRAGLHLLVRLPAAPEIWRLLVARALYRGQERRNDPRVAVGTPVLCEGPVAMGEDGETASPVDAQTILIDLSNRGCRLKTTQTLGIGDPIALTIPTGEPAHSEPDEMLRLSGRVRRLIADPSNGDGTRLIAVTFDANLEDATRTQLASVINRWASGPGSIPEPNMHAVPPIPACHLPSLPELTLDDETDPPVRSGSEILVGIDSFEVVSQSTGGQTESERRRDTRGRFESPVVVETESGRLVLIGRDLSAGGMRVERAGDLRLGDRFRIALHGPGLAEPFIVQAEVARDDGEDGFALTFQDLAEDVGREIEKLVACLPEVESLEDGEIGGLGAILSEIMRD